MIAEVPIVERRFSRSGHLSPPSRDVEPKTDDAGRIYSNRPFTEVKALRLRKPGGVIETAFNDRVRAGEILSFDSNNPLAAGDIAVIYPVELSTGGESVQMAALKFYFPSNSVSPLASREDRLRETRRIAEDERDILVDNKHRGLPIIYGYGKVDLTSSTQYPFIVREMFEETLEEAERKMEPNARLIYAGKITAQISESLAYLDENGWTFTDLTPDNIFRRKNPDGVDDWVIGDVNLAVKKDAQDIDPSSATAFGTPNGSYSPPEFRQMSLPTNKDATARAQVYSLGAIICEVLGGKADDFDPVYGQDGIFTTEKVTTSESVKTVLEKALSEEPEDRFETPSEFSKALHAAIGKYWA